MFPATRSILSVTHLRTEILTRFDLGEVTAVTFLKMGLNDTYEVKADSGKYILRVYRTPWRLESDIRFELDALLHLRRKNAPVSYPIPSQSGDLLVPIDAPEGKRYAAVFNFVEWDSYEPADDLAALFGKSAALIHAGSDDLRTDHLRFPLDFDYFINNPLALITPFLEDRSNDLTYVIHLGERVRAAIEALPIGKLNVGFCHGDMHGGNAVRQKGEVVYFDFDCCGIGPRAYDLAVFKWNAGREGSEINQWEAFLGGYRQCRPIDDVDLRAIPLFVVLRQIWFMGLIAGFTPEFGTVAVAGGFWDYNLKYLRESEQVCIAEGQLDGE